MPGNGGHLSLIGQGEPFRILHGLKRKYFYKNQPFGRCLGHAPNTLLTFNLVFALKVEGAKRLKGT